MAGIEVEVGTESGSEQHYYAVWHCNAKSAIHYGASATKHSPSRSQAGSCSAFWCSAVLSRAHLRSRKGVSDLLQHTAAT